MGRRWVLELSFLAVLAAGVVVMAYQAFGLQYEARLFPLIWLGVTLVLVGIQTVVVVVRSRRAAPGVTVSEGFESDFWSPTAMRRTGRLIIWIMAIILAIWLLGLVPGVSLGTLLYVRVEAGLSWLRSALLGALSFGYLSLVLVWGLGLRLFDGSVLLT